MKNLLRTSLVLLTLSGGLHAQPGENQVSVQFRLMAWGESDIPELHYGRDKKIELTEANTRSLPQTYMGPATLNFTLAPKITEKPADNKPAPVVASVTFPAGIKRATVLTAPNGQGRFGMYVIADDPASLPAKHARLHNLSRDRLLVGYNANERVELDPGTSALVTTSATALVIRVARTVNGQWRELFNNVIELDDTIGSNVLLMPGPQGAGIGMFAIAGWPAEPAGKERAEP
ncbi:MAG: hypothetical protein ACAH89_12255 [Rariglobus sp.]|nr:hypothetical protein [Rariglobus sp.]